MEEPARAAVRAIAEGRPLDALGREAAIAAAPDAAPRWLAEALRLGMTGRGDEAWERVRRLVGWGALAAPDAIGFASALDRPRLARPLVEDLVARGPARERAADRVMHARNLAELGRDDDARAAALGATRDSLDARTRAELAALLESLGELDALEALAVTDDALRPTAARLALWRGDAAAAAARAAGLETREGARIRAAAAVLDGRLDAAEAALGGLLGDDPRDVEAWAWRAELERARGDLAAASRALGEALERGGHGFALGLLRAHAEASGLRREDASLDAGLAAAIRAPGGIERRWGLCPDDLVREWGDPGDDPTDPATLARLTERALASLGGNRGRDVTRVESGRLRRWSPTPSVRRRSDLALLALADRPPEAVRASLDALVDAHPDSPHPRCFRGELSLFEGDDDAAAVDFEAALRLTPTRWAHVGLGAVRLRAGDLRGALRALDATAAFGFVAGATTGAYRGEALRRLGREDEARAALREAVAARPSRIGAWVNLALLGDDAARDALRVRAPALLHLAAQRDPGAPLDAALELLRGNRSSRLLTVVVDGALRVLPDPARVAAFARSLRPRASVAATPAGLAAARRVAEVLVRAPGLPAPLPILGLSLLAVSPTETDAIDLVLGRTAELARLRVHGPGRVEPIAPPRLEAHVREALRPLAARLARATTPARWREARRFASAMGGAGLEPTTTDL